MSKVFRKLVAIEPVSLEPWAEAKLADYADEVILYPDIPADDAEKVRRIGDADGVLLSYTSQLRRPLLAQCPNIRYIGMCCSLYTPESANVDIYYARERGITVLGIRDYGDRGVVEYAISELVRFLHGFDRPMLEDLPIEITDLPVGIVGLGVSGGMIADALQFLGARVSYYARAEKPARTAQGLVYKPLHALLRDSRVVFCCLNKNVLLLDDAAFAALGDGKVLFNTSIGPAWPQPALETWLAKPNNYLVADTRGAVGSDALLTKPNVFCADVSVGRTKQAFTLLSQKVLANLDTFAQSCTDPK